MEISKTTLQKTLKMSTIGALFSFVSYFCFSALVYFSADEVARFIRFIGNNAFQSWVYYDFSGAERSFKTMMYWLSAAALGVLGFVSLVFAKASFSLAEISIKDDVNA